MATKRNTWIATGVFALFSIAVYQNCGAPLPSDMASNGQTASGGVNWGDDASFNQPSSSNGGVPMVPALIEGEQMETKSVGAQEGDAWNIWSEGTIENKVSFSKSGEYDFGVFAYGSQAAGVWPEMEVRVDGQAIGTKTVSSATTSNYVIHATVSAGTHTVAIAFLNDLMQGSEDRNLYVDKIKIIAANSSGTTSPTPAPSSGDTGGGGGGQTIPAPVGGAQMPFGSHPQQYAAGTIKPSVSQATMDQAVKSSYDLWKSRYVAQMCGNGRYVVKGGQPGKLAVSEGQGYGMLIVVSMAGYDSQARTIFDGIHLFTRDKMGTYQNMMGWVINNDCSKGSEYPAVDGDLDMALALLMAHRQWGSSGSINYLEEAKKTIAAIKQNIVKNNYIAGGPAPDLARTSDFMFAHFRAFQKYTGDATWGAVLDKSISLIEYISKTYSPNAGLQPDFIQNANTGSPQVITISRWPESDMVDKYAYNACRNPWRFGTDVVIAGDSRVKAILSKMMTFFRNSSGGQASGIKAVYRLDGSIDGNYNSMSFQAPVGVGAMVDSSNQAFLNNMWNFMASNTASSYYDHSIQLISMMVMSGNWWQP